MELALVPMCYEEQPAFYNNTVIDVYNDAMLLFKKTANSLDLLVTSGNAACKRLLLYRIVFDLLITSSFSLK